MRVLHSLPSITLILVLLHATAEAQVSYNDIYLRSCDPPHSYCVPLRDCAYLEDQIKALGESLVALNVLRDNMCSLKHATVKVCCRSVSKSVLLSAPVVKQVFTNKVHALYQVKKSLVNRINCGRIVDEQVFREDREVAAHFKDFPWMAILLFENGPVELRSMCGGSLVSDRYVLTAAHCADGREYKLTKVRFGFQEVKCYPSCVDYSVRNTIVHEKYNHYTLQNDIALLYLDKPVQEPEIVPVCLPIPEFMVNGKFTKNMKFTAVRYERDGSGSIIVPTKTKVVLENDAYCSSNTYNVPDGQKCVESQGICRGDSGSALVYPVRVNGKKSQLKIFQMGIISSGYSDCAPFTPIKMISVPYYLDWILEHIK